MKITAYQSLFALPGTILRPLVALLIRMSWLPQALKPTKLALTIFEVLKTQKADHGIRYFVELGGNDGLTQSNTILLEVDRHSVWYGILLEPSLTASAKARRVRRGTTKIVRAAAVSFGYASDFLPMVSLDLTGFSPALESDFVRSADFVEAGEKWSREWSRGQTYEAPALTLSSVLSSSGAPTFIDFLSVDVEGSELEVLKGIDFERYVFGLIAIESRNVVEPSLFLEKFGYVLLQTLGGDHLFIRAERTS